MWACGDLDKVDGVEKANGGVWEWFGGVGGGRENGNKRDEVEKVGIRKEKKKTCKKIFFFFFVC